MSQLRTSDDVMNVTTRPSRLRVGTSGLELGGYSKGDSPLHRLTVVIHHSGLLLAAVHWEADDLHLHEGVDDLKTSQCRVIIASQNRIDLYCQPDEVLLIQTAHVVSSVTFIYVYWTK